MKIRPSLLSLVGQWRQPLIHLQSKEQRTLSFVKSVISVSQRYIFQKLTRSPSIVKACNVHRDPCKIIKHCHIYTVLCNRGGLFSKQTHLDLHSNNTYRGTVVPLLTYPRVSTLHSGENLTLKQAVPHHNILKQFNMFLYECCYRGHQAVARFTPLTNIFGKTLI